MKIKKGDTVIVTSGKDKGKSASVLRAFPKKNMVLIEGINMSTRHMKANRRGSQGEIVSRPTPLNVANVALKDKKTGKPTRIAYVIEKGEKGMKKHRVAKKSGERIT